MRIVIATALFPPDVGEVAAYVKDLVGRLAREHDVSVVAYGRLPEHVAGVRVVTVDKRAPLPWRLVRFFFTLARTVRHADILFIENGPSVELPAGFVALLSRKPLIIHRGDAAAHERAQSSVLLRAIEQFASSRARNVITDMPTPRPEILPFREEDNTVFSAHEESWEKHLEILDASLQRANVSRL